MKTNCFSVFKILSIKIIPATIMFVLILGVHLYPHYTAVYPQTLADEKYRVHISLEKLKQISSVWSGSTNLGYLNTLILKPLN